MIPYRIARELVYQLDRSRQRQHLGARHVDRVGGSEREHRTDALSTREQRVAHRILQPLGSGLRSKPQCLEVALDLQP